MILQLTAGTTGAVIDTAARVAGTAVFAGFLAAAVALLYRWYVRERVPVGLALLVGLAGVAVVAGTTSLLAQEIAPGGEGPDVLSALLNVVTFVVGGVGAHLGMRVGDALGVDLFAATGGNGINGEVSELVQTVGRVISVEMPDEIGDIVGYDPVPAATKENLAGRTFLFPRRLTKAELRERFVSRLKTDYGVGHVDVEFDESGSIEYLALGSRAAGIGPTLPPATNAVAIQADPAHAASAGDLVQVWETDPARRVLTGELRGVAGEVVTVAIDAADTPRLDPTEEYKLVTLPVQDRPDREFASLLQAADETLATITVQQGSRADGATVGSLGVTVAAITRKDEPPTPLPARDRTLHAGDVLYAIATPDALRKLEAATEGAGDRSAESTRAVSGPAAAAEGEPDERDAGADGTTAEADASDDEAVEGEDVDDEGVDDEGVDGKDVDAEAADQSDDTADDDPLSGAAFPDSEDLPGIDPESAVGGEGEPSAEPPDSPDDDTDDAIPDSAAFPDSDDMPGVDDVADPVTVDESVENGDDSADDAPESDETEDTAGDPSGELDGLLDESDATDDGDGFESLASESDPAAETGLDDLLDDDAEGDQSDETDEDEQSGRTE